MARGGSLLLLTRGRAHGADADDDASSPTRDSPASRAGSSKRQFERGAGGTGRAATWSLARGGGPRTSGRATGGAFASTTRRPRCCLLCLALARSRFDTKRQRTTSKGGRPAVRAQGLHADGARGDCVVHRRAQSGLLHSVARRESPPRGCYGPSSGREGLSLWARQRCGRIGLCVCRCVVVCCVKVRLKEWSASWCGRARAFEEVVRRRRGASTTKWIEARLEPSHTFTRTRQRCTTTPSSHARSVCRPEPVRSATQANRRKRCGEDEDEQPNRRTRRASC